MQENKLPEKKMHLKVITHERVVFDADVDEIYSKGTQGEFGILLNHIPFVSALDIGVTKAVTDGKPEYFTTMGGVFEFKNNEALILTQTAERSSEIDVLRAEEAKKRAEARLEDSSEESDIKRAEVALARALARLKASGR
ncbi:MAG: F0F1 ATP synthase subunit epsilon [Candidatus Gastranaerophilaceae bacterium]